MSWNRMLLVLIITEMTSTFLRFLLFMAVVTDSVSVCRSFNDYYCTIYKPPQFAYVVFLAAFDAYRQRHEC